MPSITARTPRALIVAYADNLNALDDKLINLQSIIWAAPSLRSATEWRALIGLDATLPAPDTDALTVAPSNLVRYIARSMELINWNRTQKNLSAVFTDYEVKDVTFAAGGLPPPPPPSD